METNRLKIITADSAGDENKCKRRWIKPEVEVISRDLIKSGSANYSPEGQPTRNHFFIGDGVS